MGNEIFLEIEHLSKRYGELVAVHDLSFQVRQGEVFGLLGPNGAGKTTSINMMCGLLSPDEGAVRLQGQNLTSRQVRQLIGFCPQQIVLWEKLTCIEQLHLIGQMYGLSSRAAIQRGETLLAELGLTEKRNRQAHTLSGGMQRRLNLALALVHDPPLVILDEPEAGLDPQSRVRVRDYIRSMARHKTIIFTTHNMDEAERLVDRAAIIDHGRLLVLDTPQALKARLGEGDVLEIPLQEQTPSLSEIQAALKAVSLPIQIVLQDEILIVRGLNLVNALPNIANTLGEIGLQLRNIRLRENTLEDVFIQLTGKRLRE